MEGGGAPGLAACKAPPPAPAQPASGAGPCARWPRGARALPPRLAPPGPAPSSLHCRGRDPSPNGGRRNQDRLSGVGAGSGRKEVTWEKDRTVLRGYGCGDRERASSSLG